MMNELTCQICGKTFYAYRRDLKFCSAACRRENEREYQHRKYIERWQKEHPGMDWKDHVLCRSAELDNEHFVRANEEINDLIAEMQDEQPHERKPSMLGKKLRLLKAIGISYGDAQKADTIQRYARVDLGEGVRR